MSETDWKNRIVGYGEEKPEDLVPNPNNPRTHPDSQRDALSAVLSGVGVVQNVIVNRNTGRLVDGHLRAALAISTGQKSIPVTYVELSEAEEDEILATLDPLSAAAEFDKEKLSELLGRVSVNDVALNQLLADLARSNGIGEVKVVEDEVPEVPEKARTRTGDLYEFGRHRLLCGDSRDSVLVAKLMGEAKAVLFATDPPYGVDYVKTQAVSRSVGPSATLRPAVLPSEFHNRREAH